jgi:hypothetical protein
MNTSTFNTIVTSENMRVTKATYQLQKKVSDCLQEKTTSPVTPLYIPERVFELNTGKSDDETQGHHGGTKESKLHLAHGRSSHMQQVKPYVASVISSTRNRPNFVV